MKKVEIKWLDSHAWSGGWMTLEEALKKVQSAHPIQSTGYIIHEDNSYVTIVQNHDGAHVSMLYKIPRASITELKDA